MKALSESSDKGTTHRVDAEAMRSLYVQTPAILAGNAVGVFLVLAIFWPFADPTSMWSWACTGAALWALRLAHWLRFTSTPNATAQQLLNWRGPWLFLVLALGSVWGSAVWVFWGLGDAYRQLALVLIVYSYGLASVQLLSTQPRVFLSFLMVLMCPAVVRIATEPTLAWRYEFSGVMILLLAVTWLLGRHFAAALNQAIELKTQTEALAEQLAAEKAEAESARREAEAASRAKTQFFAAASHDLRQPLHAMGLFGEALRARSSDPQALRLIDSINESVDALESLFGQLLDVTKMDSGAVEVKMQAVKVRDLFARLKLTFEPAAFEKGLGLSFHGARHIAQADPLHLERILRNLVSNAIRYTEDGGVVVACRPRAGALLFQVWDSGMGMPADQLPRIFDEFYQVDPARPVQAHQRKGLGLGLSIVKRLGALMGTEISVRSHPGRGTVFSFLTPVGQPQATTSDPAQAPVRRLNLTLQGRRFVVVEDDPAVREGLSVLLQSWGATVDAFDSLAALAHALPQWAQAPDLALVDYRLSDHETGLQALDMLRAQWPLAAVPAIVISGSNTLVGHEDLAQKYGYHLLVKPVLPNKLRAMIGFKLGMR